MLCMPLTVAYAGFSKGGPWNLRIMKTKKRSSLRSTSFFYPDSLPKFQWGGHYSILRTILRYLCINGTLNGGHGTMPPPLKYAPGPRSKLVVTIGWWWGTIFFKAQWKLCLDDKLWRCEKMLLSLVLLMAVVDLLQSLAVVVSAETRRGNKEKPGKAVWFAGSLWATNIQYIKRCASLVKLNKLFFLYSFLYVVNTLIDLCCFNKITSPLENHI